MPKHDEPITMAEKAERHALLNLQGASSFWRTVDFDDEKIAAHRADIIRTMPGSEDAKEKWIFDIERAVNSYIHDDGRLVRKIRARMEQMKEAITPLRKFFEGDRTVEKTVQEAAKDKDVDFRLLEFLETIDAGFDANRKAIFRELIGRSGSGVKFDGAISYLDFVLERGLEILPAPGRGTPPDFAQDRLAEKLSNLWTHYTGSKPVNSTNWDTGKMQGAFADHVRAIVRAIPEEHRPDTKDGFIRRAFKQ